MDYPAPGRWVSLVMSAAARVVFSGGEAPLDELLDSATQTLTEYRRLFAGEEVSAYALDSEQLLFVVERFDR